MKQQRQTQRRSTRAGFTFVEILVAMVFLGILVPVIISALLLANKASVVAERATIATQLGENKLGELMIDNAWNTASKNGDFGQDYPGYRWVSNQTNWSADTNMTEFDLDVFYTVQGKERSLHFGTLVNTALTSASPSASASASSAP